MLTCLANTKQRRFYGISEIPDEKIGAAQKEFEPLWLNGTLSEGQSYYAAWCRVLGEKAVDRWIATC